MTIREFYYSNSWFLDLLYSSIWEYALLLTIREETLNSSIWEWNLLCSILEVFLNLIIRKLEDLKSIWECRLGSFSFSKVIDNLLVWECLLDIVIGKVYNRIAWWPNFSSHTIAENHFLLSIIKESLLLSIMGGNFIN